MSVSFKYRVAKGGKSIPHGTSSDIPILEEVFGRIPVVLGEEDVPKLRAMALVCVHQPNIYSKLAEIIDDIGSIELFTEY